MTPETLLAHGSAPGGRFYPRQSGSAPGWPPRTECGALGEPARGDCQLGAEGGRRADFLKRQTGRAKPARRGAPPPEPVGGTGAAAEEPAERRSSAPR